MKQSVAVALIVMGALLIMAPQYFDHLHGRVRDTYHFLCWITGLTMIVVAMAGSASAKFWSGDGNG